MLDQGKRNAFARAGGAGKRDAGKIRAVEHGLADDGAAAHDEIEDALRQANAVQDIDDSREPNPAPDRPA